MLSLHSTNMGRTIRVQDSSKDEKNFRVIPMNLVEIYQVQDLTTRANTVFLRWPGGRVELQARNSYEYDVLLNGLRQINEACMEEAHYNSQVGRRVAKERGEAVVVEEEKIELLEMGGSAKKVRGARPLSGRMK